MIWKDVIGYEGAYQVSDCGQVKSLIRNKERILKLNIEGRGYYTVALKGKTRKVHQLVAEAFLGHKPNGHVLEINHKDINRLNNHVSNLEIVTQRVNCNKKHLPSSSQYTGVGWHKVVKKWVAQIQVGGKKKHLGCFDSEYDAHLAYEKAIQ